MESDSEQPAGRKATEMWGFHYSLLKWYIRILPTLQEGALSFSLSVKQNIKPCMVYTCVYVCVFYIFIYIEYVKVYFYIYIHYIYILCVIFIIGH